MQDTIVVIVGAALRGISCRMRGVAFGLPSGAGGLAAGGPIQVCEPVMARRIGKSVIPTLRRRYAGCAGGARGQVAAPQPMIGVPAMSKMPRVLSRGRTIVQVAQVTGPRFGEEV